MNKQRFFVILFLVIINHLSLFGQDSIVTKILLPLEKEAFPIGDMNNDGVLDTIFVVTPPCYFKSINDTLFESCFNDSCFNKIIFSCGLPEIYVENSLWGRIEPLADLNGDGMNEFLFQRDWFIGTHISIYIYSFVNGKWVILAENYLYGEDSYTNRINKINNKKFNFTIEVRNHFGDYIQKTIRVKTIKNKIK